MNRPAAVTGKVTTVLVRIDCSQSISLGFTPFKFSLQDCKDGMVPFESLELFNCVKFAENIGGLPVQAVDAQGNAARAGLRVWDVIIGVNGSDVRSISGQDVFNLLKQTPPNEAIALTVCRTSDPPPAPDEKASSAAHSPEGKVFISGPVPPSSPSAINFATEWLDELGCVCPKAVDYASQCPKGHALAAFSNGSGASAVRLTCRICHTFTERDGASQWLVCSAMGCCAGYAVCDCCVRALQQAPAAAAGDDDGLSSLVRHIRTSYHSRCSRCCRASLSLTCSGSRRRLGHRLAG
jgi:hypothetical protein